jgi:2-polyprenyl-3-methyl-5-hydroxy-6-metoxy-1,4-benzoquinol methylase
MYSKLTIENDAAIKRFSHTRRFKIALDMLKLEFGESVLDYGTGDGYFLISLKNKNSKAKAFGYEPVSEMFDNLLANLRDSNYLDEVQVFQSLDSLLDMHFEKITCFEVLEHLDRNLQKNALQNMKKMLRQDGLLLISIPIEVGFSSLIKNVLRIILGQEHDARNLTNIIKSFLCIHIERESSPYISSHIGFYFHDLEKIFLEEGLLIKQIVYSPFKYWGSIVNSQIFYILSVRRGEE